MRQSAFSRRIVHLWQASRKSWVGALSDRTRTRIGRRKPYLLGGLPTAAGALLLLSMRPPVWLAIAVLVVMTTSLAVTCGPYLASLADLDASELRGRVGGLQAAANMIGQMTMLWVAAQLHTVPSRVSARLWLKPPRFATASPSQATRIGLPRLEVVPSPSWPNALFPHAQTVPSCAGQVGVRGRWRSQQRRRSAHQCR